LRALVRETGVATLYVNHDLALLATLANRLAIMYAGQIHEIGSTEAVCVRPSHPYTQALMAAVPSARNLRSVAGLGGRPPSTCSLDGCSFAPRCPHVIAECRVGHISLREVDDGHFARCIRAGEVRAPIPTGLLLQGHLRPKADPLLKVEDVWCGYRSGGTSVAAVRGVSFGISRAETLSVVGESGSGKSTLLRAIIGLHAPTAGSITFRGEKLAKRASERAPSIRRELQLIFQNPDSSLNPRHTVARIIGRPMRLFRDDITRSQEREAVAELLEAVKLPRSLLDRYPSELSGGQKQRVALARAFAPRPSLLLCDEVTTSLDVSVQATILELISELAQSHGTAVIFVSHDLAVVRSIATRVLVMRQGEVCEEADAEQLFLSPSHPYTQELLSAIPELPIISPT
jgi:peptide/nickel transport system ATP-binding protein